MRKSDNEKIYRGKLFAAKLQWPSKSFFFLKAINAQLWSAEMAMSGRQAKFASGEKSFFFDKKRLNLSLVYSFALLRFVLHRLRFSLFLSKKKLFSPDTHFA